MDNMIHQLAHHQHAGLVFALLLIYQLKHFLCDYPLQTKFMLNKFRKRARDWVPALAAHAGVHAWATLAIAMVFGMDEWQGVMLGAFDFVIHFVMDRIKASPKLLGRYEALSKSEYLDHLVCSEGPKASRYGIELAVPAFRSNKLFWWSLGLDQAVHHITHYAIIAYIVCNS